MKTILPQPLMALLRYVYGSGMCIVSPSFIRCAWRQLGPFSRSPLELKNTTATDALNLRAQLTGEQHDPHIKKRGAPFPRRMVRKTFRSEGSAESPICCRAESGKGSSRKLEQAEKE
jgi:hypothetical protein